jgi:hypothetical protein
MVEIFEDEEVSQGGDVSEKLDDYVFVVVGFDIVYPDET